jgi:hypothetical protein
MKYYSRANRSVPKNVDQFISYNLKEHLWTLPQQFDKFLKLVTCNKFPVTDTEVRNVYLQGLFT